MTLRLCNTIITTPTTTKRTTNLLHSIRIAQSTASTGNDYFANTKIRSPNGLTIYIARAISAACGLLLLTIYSVNLRFKTQINTQRVRWCLCSTLTAWRQRSHSSTMCKCSCYSVDTIWIVKTISHEWKRHCFIRLVNTVFQIYQILIVGFISITFLRRFAKNFRFVFVNISIASRTHDYVWIWRRPCAAVCGACIRCTKCMRMHCHLVAIDAACTRLELISVRF